jgi:hypothetical protein
MDSLDCTKSSRVSLIFYKYISYSFKRGMSHHIIEIKRRLTVGFGEKGRTWAVASLDVFLLNERDFQHHHEWLIH